MTSPFYWLLICASFICAFMQAQPAQAETIPATQVQVWGPRQSVSDNCGTQVTVPKAYSMQDFNNNFWAHAYPAFYLGPARSGDACGQPWTYRDGPATISGNTISFNYRSCTRQSGNLVCGPSTPSSFTQTPTTEYQCPAGYTLDGNMCTGEPPPDQCETQQGNVAAEGLFDIGTSPINSPDAVACDGQCQVVFSGNSPAYTALQAGTRHYYAIGTYNYTGEQCSGGSGLPTAQASPPPDTCGAGQVKGTVNGKTVCVDSSTGTPAPTEPAPAPVTETEQTDPPVTNPDGSTTQTTTRTNSDGSTTTTTTTTNPDGSTSTSTVTTPPTGSSQFDDYCAANPTAPICKGTSACEENPDGPECKFACEKYPNIISCMEAGEIPESDQLSELTRTLTFTEVSLPKASGCPAPATLSLGGHTISMSFDPICQYASAFYYLVMALAYLSAAYIVFGALRSDPVGA